jgi:hypothetical protein
MNMIQDREFQKRIQRIEVLIKAMEGLADPIAREAAREMVRVLLELHGAGLSKILEFAAQAGEAGLELIDCCERDSLVANLLLLHGLHSVDLNTRIERALDKVRISFRPQGFDVQLISLAQGIVRLCLNDQGNGFSSTATSFRRALEEAITEAAPDVLNIAIDDGASQDRARVSLPLV